LAKKAGGLNGETFVVDMPVDTDAVRRARAESDVIMGDIMKKPVSLVSPIGIKEPGMIGVMEPVLGS
jgi:hypothetical protein